MGEKIMNKSKLLLASGIAVMSTILTMAFVLPQISEAQGPPTDFFALSCDEVKGKVNGLLNSKGPIQQNMLAVKEMIFLMEIYDDKCGTPVTTN
jgi:hypothetical protein